jgi:hypothetical protein
MNARVLAVKVVGIRTHLLSRVCSIAALSVALEVVQRSPFRTSLTRKVRLCKLSTPGSKNQRQSRSRAWVFVASTFVLQLDRCL